MSLVKSIILGPFIKRAIYSSLCIYVCTIDYILPCNFSVPPKIAPIQWYPAYNQGSRISAVCSVEQGDVEETNLTVGWLKDSVPIGLMTTSNFIKVVHVDAFSAMLIIDRVDTVHQGQKLYIA
jgi:hypothetical protein